MSAHGVGALAYAGEKGGEKGGMFPTVRHEYLMQLIGRSHSPPRPRRKNGRGEGDLKGIVQAPFSRRLQKQKQNHREQQADHSYIAEKGNSTITEIWRVPVR